MIPFRRLFALAFAVNATLGCASKKPVPQPMALHVYKPKPSVDVIGTSYQAVDTLIGQLKISLAENTPIIVATLVTINQLEHSSPFGRLVAEQMANRFTLHGYQVIEVKTRNQLYLKLHQGELILSREVRDLAQRHKVRVIVSGTYTEIPDRVFVNLKVINLDENLVLAAHDYMLEKDDVIKSLLNS